MKFSERLYNEASDIWQGYYSHPFVKGIGDGSLDIEKFKFFMVQDYLYLLQYAKVFALGVIKAQNEADMRFFAQSVEATLNGEMKIHRAYMKRLGITEKELESCKMSLANSSYTRYMLAMAFEGDIADIMAAILACSWSYAEIGKRLNAIKGAAEHPFYGEWIQGYSSEEYISQNDELIEFIERLAAGCSELKLKRMSEIFIDCSRYEAEFWDMAWNMED